MENKMYICKICDGLGRHLHGDGPGGSGSSFWCRKCNGTGLLPEGHSQGYPQKDKNSELELRKVEAVERQNMLLEKIVEQAKITLVKNQIPNRTNFAYAKYQVELAKVVQQNGK